MRISTERLRELRNAELLIVQRPFMDTSVKNLAAEMAEALGELLEYRDAEEQGERMLETKSRAELAKLLSETPYTKPANLVSFQDGEKGKIWGNS